MASSSMRNPANRPKKYPDAIPAHQVIQGFFNQQLDSELESQFTLLCRRNPTEYGQQLAWLVKNGCVCSIPQIKAWLKVKGIKAGTEADTLNRKLEEYAGIDVVGGLESLAVRTANLAFDYGGLIQNKLDGGEITDSQMQSIIAQYPAVVGQTKQILQALAQVKERTGERELLLAGADRVKSLVLNMLEKNSPFRPALEQYFQAAIQRIAEEV
ncbi:MAG: hypothetical protein ACK5U6_17325 [Pseudanabaena sp.]|jgi:hypothetical protein